MVPSNLFRCAVALATTLVLTSCGGASNRGSLPLMPTGPGAYGSAALQPAAAGQILYVAEASAAPGSIGEYTLSGAFLRRVPAKLISKSHPLDAPARIAVDGAGTLYVYNSGLDTPTVTEYASGQTSVLRTIKSGIGSLAFNGLLADLHGDLYALNEKTASARGSLTGYDPAAVVPSIVVRKGLFRPVALGIDSTGIVYVANRSEVSASPKNTIVEYAGNSAAPLRTIQEGPKRPDSIAVDARGTLFVLYATTGTPDVVNRIDEFPKSTTKPNLTVRLPDTPGFVASLRADSLGTLYVYNQGKLYVYPRGTTKPSMTITAPSGSFFSSLAFDASRNLYAVTQGGNSGWVVFYRRGSSQGRRIVAGDSYFGPILIGP